MAEQEQKNPSGSQSSQLSGNESDSAPEPRPRCLRCFRPASMCFCSDLDPVANKTPVYILQHPAERRHPFGTVKLTRQMLKQVNIHVSASDEPDTQRWRASLPEGTAILYPGPQARQLGDIPPGERPKALLVLDGTWSTAKKLLRFHPWAIDLPQVALTPTEPGRYRIRKEPTDQHLSTIEAIHQALVAIEPETQGLERLTEALDKLVDVHLEARGRSNQSSRYKRAPENQATELWRIICGAPETLVIAEAEAGRHLGPDWGKTNDSRLFRITLRRLAPVVDRSQTLDILIEPESKPNDTLLSYFRLTREQSEQTLAPQLAADRIVEWLGDDGNLLTWTHGIGQKIRAFLSAHGHDVSTPPSLKELYGNLNQSAASGLDQLAEDQVVRRVDIEGLEGRIANRLGAAVAMAQHLRGSAPARWRESATRMAERPKSTAPLSPTR